MELYLFAYSYPIVPETFVENTVLSLLHCLCNLVKTQLTVNVWVYFWILFWWFRCLLHNFQQYLGICYPSFCCWCCLILWWSEKSLIWFLFYFFLNWSSLFCGLDMIYLGEHSMFLCREYVCSSLVMLPINISWALNILTGFLSTCYISY